MYNSLSTQLAARLADAEIDPDVASLVEAAVAGAKALDDHLQGREPLVPDSQAPRAATPRAWLESLTVEGFRGIGEPLTVELDTEPGLVVFAGRNGSGKSTLAEALDTLLTGVSHRWEGRHKAFESGWANLHHEDGRRVRASFAVEGRAEPLTVERQWSGDDVGASVLRVDGEEVRELGLFGGIDGARAWRPVLSCGELGRKVEAKPSALFDAIAGVLGLEALTEACDHLRKAERQRCKQGDAAKQALEGLRGRLTDIEEPRARRCAALLGEESPDLVALQAVLDERGDEALSADLERLRRMAGLGIPGDTTVAEQCAALQAAAATVELLEKSQAGMGERMATLLEQAIRLREAGRVDCPVCETPEVLDEAWAARAQLQLDASRRAAKDLADARRRLADAESDLRRTLRPLQTREAPEVAADALRRWQSRDLEGAKLADDVHRHWAAVRDAFERAKQDAASELAERQAAWGPLATTIGRWCEDRRAADLAEAEAKHLRQAEQWLKDAEGDLRDERFAPIRDEAVRIWSVLRQDSHVELDEVALSGGRTRRRLDLKVSVDGVSTDAQGVMSQGELNALALSLFVPRTVLADSPFRFVVIDDPVQAMDPHKVDGLARALGELATTRQTLVLTHDERLLESLRRQRIAATVFGVQRQPGSRVSILRQQDPVSQLLDDATRVLSAGSIDRSVRDRVVPGFCREALEAELVRIVRRRRLGRGEAHADVEQVLQKRSTLRSLAALALFDDHRQGREVEARLEEVARNAGELFGELNAGSHRATTWDSTRLVRGTRELVRRLDGAVT